MTCNRFDKVQQSARAGIDGAESVLIYNKLTKALTLSVPSIGKVKVSYVARLFYSLLSPNTPNMLVSPQ